MKEITIKITISEDEYKFWTNYENGGVNLVKTELKQDFIETCFKLGIKYNEIIVTED